MGRRRARATLVAKREQRRRLAAHQLRARRCRSARAIAQALLDHGLSAERPVAILSDNDIEHLLLALGAMLAGVPFAPISPAYSLISQDYGKLRHILGMLTPGLVFAASGAAFGKAIAATVPRRDAGRRRPRAPRRPRDHAFDELLAARPTAAVDAAHAQVGPDTIAKFLFTSGSTKLPKGVINTQRMLCANQQMILQCFPHLAEEPPVLVDWLPWNHTFGGNHNVGIVALQRRHALHRRRQADPGADRRDAAQPARDRADALLQRAQGLRGDRQRARARRALRETFFSRVKMFFFAGAGLSQPVWDKLDRARRAGVRRAHPDAHRPRHDRDRAVRDLRQRARGQVGPHRPAGAGRRAEAGAERRQGRGALPRPQRDAGLLARARADAPSVRRGRLLLQRRRRQADGSGASRAAASCSTAASPRTSSSRPAPSSRSARCARRSSPPATRCVQDVVVAGINRDEIGMLLFPRARCVSRVRRRRDRRAARRGAATRACASSSSAWSTALGERHRQRDARRARARAASSRRRSTAARSPTRARSTSAPC